MSNLLVIKSSASGEASVSNRLVDQLVARIRDERPDIGIVERDLDRAPIPHLRSSTLGGIGRPAPETDESRSVRALSDALVAELVDADAVVIGVPMYNFGMPSTLKSWFDHIVRAGLTFQYGANGPEGLVPSKPVVLIETRAGVYSAGPAAAMDGQEPHLRNLLGFIGLTDLDIVRIEGLAMGVAADVAAVDAAADRLAAKIGPDYARAA